MKTNILPAIRLTFVSILFFVGFYTLVVLGIAQIIPNKGKAEIMYHDNQKFYTNIGQSFTLDKYFNSRPSAASYNAAASCGSNKGPSNPDNLKEVQSRIDSFLVHNPSISKNEIPSDLVTASGSGLDPNISVQAAKVQVKRIAIIRNISESDLMQLIEKQTEKPLFGLFGTEKINVLKLNIALDNLSI